MGLFRKKKEELPESLSLPPVFPQGNIEDNPEDAEEDVELERLQEEVKKLEEEKKRLQQNQKTSKEEQKYELTEERLIAILQNFSEGITELQARINNIEGFLFRHRSI